MIFILMFDKIVFLVFNGLRVEFFLEGVLLWMRVDFALVKFLFAITC